MTDGPAMKKFLITLLILLTLPALSFAARQSPVDGGTVTSGVGWRLDPFGSGRQVYHNGYDIAVPSGTPVHPTQAGTVYFAGPYKGYGNLVAVEHGKGYVTFYGHNSEVLVKPGQFVDTDTVIALSGSTGRSTGPHVHYEVRQFPGAEKREREQLEAGVMNVIEKNVDNWVEDFISGKGGPEPETYLPDDLHE
ncbi:MAG: peptidase [Geobacteraceae bacterium]|nr:MAG: peptidase [Geobacteraceae bacterium]